MPTVVRLSLTVRSVFTQHIDCPRLETVAVEESRHASFGRVASVSWKNFPALRTIDLGNKSFPIASSLSVVSNPLLRTVSLGDHSFNGSGNNRVVFSSEHLFSFVTQTCRLSPSSPVRRRIPYYSPT